MRGPRKRLWRPCLSTRRGEGRVVRSGRCGRRSRQKKQEHRNRTSWAERRRKGRSACKRHACAALLLASAASRGCLVKRSLRIRWVGSAHKKGCMQICVTAAVIAVARENLHRDLVGFSTMTRGTRGRRSPELQPFRRWLSVNKLQVEARRPQPKQQKWVGSARLVMRMIRTFGCDHFAQSKHSVRKARAPSARAPSHKYSVYCF